MVYGKYALLDKNNKNIFSYTREANGKKVLVLLNFTKEPSSFKLNDLKLGNELINNLAALKVEGGVVNMLPYQAAIVELN